ncbi:adhesin [Acinetobacter sp. Ac_877]|uniref:fimbrial protein n=1 Tax=Acinetobacter portensis TaxID=1839785 RepID=UPI00128CF2BC|nr:fimbrial protein [Acinetobacter portensis]MPW40172.1 adhesin [Acinetobacter portensis]
MKFNFLIFALLFGFSVQANAHICWNSKGQGVVDEVFYDLSNTFTSSNNKPGEIVELLKQFNYRVTAVCPKHSSSESNNRTRRSYVTEFPIVETLGGYQYLKLNDYLLGAMAITDSYAGTFYPPVDHKQMGSHPNVSKGTAFPVTDSNFRFRLKVIKPFIDFIPIPKRTLFKVYVTTGYDALTTPVYEISYSGSVTVPQSCDIGVGDTLDIDFGKISSQAFVQAGAGNKPVGTNEQVRTLAIQCKNINSYAALTIRLEAELVSGEIMQTSNPDIGVKISDNKGKVLIPNNINSTIPFIFNNPPVNVVIKAWPISLTGKAPEVGPFRARGYLRVDFE